MMMRMDYLLEDTEPLSDAFILLHKIWPFGQTEGKRRKNTDSGSRVGWPAYLAFVLNVRKKLYT